VAILGELLCIVMVFEDARHPQSSNLSKSDQELLEQLTICVYIRMIDQVANCIFIPPEKWKFRLIFCTIFGLRHPQKIQFLGQIWFHSWHRNRFHFWNQKKGSLTWAWQNLVPFLEPGFGPFRSEIGFFFGTGREPTLGLARSSSFLGLRFPHVCGSLGRACALL